MDTQHPSVSLKDIFRRSQLVMLLTSGCLLLVMVGAVTLFSIKNYAHSHVQLVSETLADRLQAALVFRDDEYIINQINSYVDHALIQSVSVYDEQGSLIVESKQTVRPYLYLQDVLDIVLYNNKTINIPIYDKRQTPVIVVGSIDVLPSSQYIATFFAQVLIGMLVSLLCIMLIGFYSVRRLYRKVTDPLYPVTNIATLVQDCRAYNLRFPTSDIKEFNLLIETFNQVLSEMDSRHVTIQQENEELSYKANHDELTGLANRHVFYQRLHEIFQDPIMRQNSALIFVDCNRFKQINDTYGHQAGDAVLKAAAQRLKQRVRHLDLVARLGGDEFAIILYSIHKASYLTSIAEHLMSGSEEPIIFDDEEIFFGFSMGIAFSAYATSTELWIEQADQAMYHAKFLDQHWAIFKPKVGDS